MTTMPTARLAATVALLLTLLVTGQPAAAQGQPDESILTEFQVFTCPAGYADDDYLADCPPAGPGDYAITVTDTSPTEPTATTAIDADGYVSFATLPGPARFVLDVPVDATLYYACFDGTGVFMDDGEMNVIQVSLAEGEGLSCRWYVTPSDAASGSGAGPTTSADPADGTVGIQVFDCPAGYDPVSYGGDQYSADCSPTSRPVGMSLNDGYTFDEATSIYGQADDDGRLGFVDLLAGQYHLSVEELSETSAIYWECSERRDGVDQPINDGGQNRMRFYVTQSGKVSCRVYLTADAPPVPEAGSPGTITVLVLSCPESYRGPDWADQCTEPIDSDNRVSIDGDPTAREGGRRAGQAMYEGRVTFEDVLPGTYGAGTDIPGHSTEQRGACVVGAGPIDDALIDDDPSNDWVVIGEGEGATCVIYITGISLRG